MAVKISDLPIITTATDDDYLPMVDPTSGQTRRILKSDLLKELRLGTDLAAQAVKANKADFSVADQAARDAFTPYEGLQVFRRDTDAIEIYDGSAWIAYDTIWQTYTPTLTNITLGNGSLTGCKYFRTGKKVAVKFRLKFGTTTGMGTDPTISLPLTAAALNATANIPILGWGQYFDISTGSPFPCAIEHASTTTCTIRAMATNGTFLTPQVIAAATPFAFAVNDELAGDFYYEMA